MNIILTGFMGTGKTVVGVKLAQELNWPYIDIDELIIEKENKSISDIFSLQGQEYFRKVETECIAEVIKKDNQVIATGGGAITIDKSYELMKTNGIIICLEAAPEVILDRLKDDKSRPLLAVENPFLEIKNLLDKREKHYNKADYKIDTTGKTLDEVTSEIKEKLKKFL